jgi:hypothetical protein
LSPPFRGNSKEAVKNLKFKLLMYANFFCLNYLFYIFVFKLKKGLYKKMDISKDAVELRKRIDRAIECQEISYDEYEALLAIAYEDGVLDQHEKALLRELQSMIAHNDIKIVRSKKS